MKNAPAYSGLKKRKYDTSNVIVEEIRVQTNRLDNVVPDYLKIDFIKIDVEGAELDVIKGGMRTIASSRPYVLFEFGLGGSDFYGATPELMYKVICIDLGLKINTMKRWMNGDRALTQEDVVTIFNANSDYYFLAIP